MPDPFYVRFNIDVPIDDAQQRFINRIENRVRQLARKLESLGEARLGQSLDDIIIEVENRLGEPHLTYVLYATTFADVWKKRVNEDFLRCLQAVESLYETLNSYNGRSYGILDTLNEAISNTLAQSEFDLAVSWQNGFFLRKGAELLDEKLVNASLRWLADPRYENVLIPFRKGLSHLLEGTKDPQRYGDAVTDMYEALEAMAKIVTGKPTEELSTLREQFISKMRLSHSHKAMLKSYIDYGCDFRHAVKTGKQRSWPLEHEAENFVYLTGLFIRLAIQEEKL